MDFDDARKGGNYFDFIEGNLFPKGVSVYGGRNFALYRPHFFLVKYVGVVVKGYIMCYQRFHFEKLNDSLLLDNS